MKLAIAFLIYFACSMSCYSQRVHPSRYYSPRMLLSPQYYFDGYFDDPMGYALPEENAVGFPDMQARARPAVKENPEKRFLWWNLANMLPYPSVVVKPASAATTTTSTTTVTVTSSSTTTFVTTVATVTATVGTQQPCLPLIQFALNAQGTPSTTPCARRRRQLEFGEQLAEASRIRESVLPSPVAPMETTAIEQMVPENDRLDKLGRELQLDTSVSIPHEQVYNDLPRSKRFFGYLGNQFGSTSTIVSTVTSTVGLVTVTSSATSYNLITLPSKRTYTLVNLAAGQTGPLACVPPGFVVC